jgi:hypothetical protein
VGLALIGALPLVALGTGCVLPVAYDVIQSSTIPLPTPTPPPSSRGLADLYAGVSTLTVAEPAPTAGSDSSLYVPRTQLEGALSFRRAVVGWRVLGGLSLGEGPSVSSTPLPRASNFPGFVGPGLDFGFFDENERFSAMFSVEVLAGFATSVQEATPIYADGTRGPSYRITGTDFVFIVGGQASVGYWVADWCRLMGGLGLRTSPTNRAHFVAEARNSFLVPDPPSGVGFGEAVGLLWVGAELRLPVSGPVNGSLVPSIAWPFAGGPITYGPIVTVGIRVTFGTLRGSSLFAPHEERSGEAAPAEDEAE